VTGWRYTSTPRNRLFVPSGALTRPISLFMAEVELEALTSALWYLASSPLGRWLPFPLAQAEASSSIS
jgi:hypothetical protein